MTEPTVPSGDPPPESEPARRRFVPPRWARWTAAAVLAVLVSVVWGVTTARTEGSLGPNEATYRVTTDGDVTVDLGPLGTLVVDSPAPLGLGVDITVHEIPAELTSLSEADTLTALGGDLGSYLQFFATPDTTARRVLRELVVDAAWRALGALAVIVLVTGGVHLLLGPARRRELAGRAAAHAGELTAATAVVVVAALVLTASEPRQAAPQAVGSPVFVGTPLEGARLTGRLAGVLNTYGTQLVETYRTSQDFYAEADQSLQAAFDARAAEDAAAAASATPTPPPAGLTGAAGGTGGAAEPTATPTTNPSDVVTLLMVSDLHCNTGMSPLIRTAVERSGAQVVLNGGDTTINGTSVEQVCVDSFADAMPRGTHVVVADGNHDSRLVSGFESKRGWTVLDGSVVTVDGIRILGDRDVRETRIGVASRLVGTTTAADRAQDLAATACDARGDDGAPGVDLLLVHDPAVGADALGTGCVPAQLSGHLHRRIDPVQVGLGIRYVNSSTAGATLNQLTVGPLKGTAEMTVLRFDKGTKKILDWQLVEVTKQGVASVGPRQAWPTPSPVPVPEGPLPPGD